MEGIDPIGSGQLGVRDGCERTRVDAMVVVADVAGCVGGDRGLDSQAAAAAGASLASRAASVRNCGSRMKGVSMPIAEKDIKWVQEIGRASGREREEVRAGEVVGIIRW